jgi:membrane protease YdiL (CAAX protease family)
VARRNGVRHLPGAYYHLQFGINAAVAVFALGMMFGFTYWRWRQLWPLVVAHVLADLLAFSYGSCQAT